MEWHEDAVGAHESEPEMHLSKSFIHHRSKHLREPEISSRKDSEDRRNRHYQVEMAHDEIGGMQHDVERRLCQEKSTHPAADEHRDHAQCEQGRSVDAKLGAIQATHPDEHNNR